MLSDSEKKIIAESVERIDRAIDRERLFYFFLGFISSLVMMVMLR